MEMVEEEVIVVGQHAPGPMETRSSRRVVRPSTKVRDTAQQLEESAVKETKKSDNGKSSTGNNDGRAMLQKVLELLAESRTETKWMRTALMEQSETMRQQQVMILELTRQLDATKTQLKEAHEKLDAITTRVESPLPSYAEIARTPPSSQPSNVRSFSSGLTTPSMVTDTLYCTIDASRVEEENRDKAKAGGIRRAIEEEMRAAPERPDWRCAAVVQDAKRPDRIKIICRDEAEMQLVKEAAQKTAIPGTRVMRDQYYPVKIDNVNRTAVLDEHGSVLPEAVEALGSENQVNIAKISWLSNRSSHKAYGSMVVYVTKRSDAKKLLDGRYFDLAGESAYTNVFEPRREPLQCFNCQEMGHKAFSCGKPQACARCAVQGHHHKQCEAVEPKCIPCGGPHESFSRNCRVRNLPIHA